MHLSRRLKCTIVITHCPSVCLSVRHPSLTFHIFDFSSETAEWNSMKLDKKQDLNVLYQVCVFRANRKNKMAVLASDWLRHFQILSNSWTEFKESWQEARSQRPLPSLCFGPIGKTRWLLWPLFGWDIFDFSSETAKRNSMQLDRRQDLNVLFQVCVLRADRKNKMAALASDWLRHFWLLWNSLTKFNETWKESRSHSHLPSLCFRVDGKNKMAALASEWLAETFSTSPLNGIQRNLTGSKISTSFTKFVFCRSIGKTKWPSWPLIGWDIFDFSSETTEQNSTKLDNRQDLNVLYQVCVFRADRKNKMAALAMHKTWQEARSPCPLPSLYFLPISKQKWPPWSIPQKGGTLYSAARYVALWASCYEIKCSIHI